jgi:hypothetical protein
MRPINDARDMSMFHWIEMDVIDMALQIRVIANRVFPIATLPDALFSFASFARRSLPRIKSPRKTTLDQAPSSGEIGFSIRQRPNRVKMVGQNADRDRLKRAILLNGSIDTSKAINLLHQQAARSFGQNDREEEYAPFEFGSGVTRHHGSSQANSRHDGMVSTPSTPRIRTEVAHPTNYHELRNFVEWAKAPLRRAHHFGCKRMVGTPSARAFARSDGFAHPTPCCSNCRIAWW